MRFEKEDKKLQSNLRILLLCSKLKTIKLSNLTDKIERKQLDFLNSPKHEEFRNFLEKTYISQNEKAKIKLYSPIEPEDYMDLNVPENEVLADINSETIYPDYVQYRKMQKQLERISKTQTEHTKLRKILYGNDGTGKTSEEQIKRNTSKGLIARNVDLKKLKNFLNDKTHTISFQNFGTEMLEGNPAITLIKYKIAARKLAKEENLLSDSFDKKIYKTFSLPKINLKLNQEMRGRFIPAGAKIAAASLASFLAINGAIGLFNFVRDKFHDNSTTYTSASDQPSLDPDPLITAMPISNGIHIDSYESAAKDLFQKVGEVYSYNNNGKKVNLSDLTYSNIGQSKSKIAIVVANYNGKEYRFSTMSDLPENGLYLIQALQTNDDDKNVTVYESQISFLTRGDKSIAISDSNGNPVQSGKVLEETQNGKTKYKQEWVNTAKKMMQEKGISTAGKSDDELVGYYLLNSTPEQDPELSKSLGTVVPLIDYMKSTFYYKDGNCNSYAVSQYASKSRDWAKKFNEQASNDIELAKESSQNSTSANSNDKSKDDDDYEIS